MAKDVVCGMDVDEQWVESRQLVSRHQDWTYYFCSKQCKRQFDLEPQRYTARPTSGPDVEEQWHENYLG